MIRPVRFADAAYAIEATPETLRKWFTYGFVRFEMGGGGWAEYSPRAIAQLALMRPLVAFGFGVETAWGMAQTAIEDAAEVSSDWPKSFDPDEAARFADLWMFAMRVDEPGQKPEPNARWDFFRTDQIGSLVERPGVLLPLEKVILRAFERAVSRPKGRRATRSGEPYGEAPEHGAIIPLEA